jgi:hypothetical protein
MCLLNQCAKYQYGGGATVRRKGSESSHTIGHVPSVTRLNKWHSGSYGI